MPIFHDRTNGASGGQGLHDVLAALSARTSAIWAESDRDQRTDGIVRLVGDMRERDANVRQWVQSDDVPGELGRVAVLPYFLLAAGLNKSGDARSKQYFEFLSADLTFVILEKSGPDGADHFGTITNGALVTRSLAWLKADDEASASGIRELIAPDVKDLDALYALLLGSARSSVDQAARYLLAVWTVGILDRIKKNEVDPMLREKMRDWPDRNGDGGLRANLETMMRQADLETARSIVWNIR